MHTLRKVIRSVICELSEVIYILCHL